MARVGAEAKALILLVTFFPQCVVSTLSMTPPIMASQIAHSRGLSPEIAGAYIGLVYGAAVLSSSFSADRRRSPTSRSAKGVGSSIMVTWWEPVYAPPDCWQLYLYTGSS
jgi:hypothetical protein